MIGGWSDRAYVGDQVAHGLVDGVFEFCAARRHRHDLASRPHTHTSTSTHTVTITHTHRDHGPTHRL
eukprot:1768043-Rhodomonas_salina.1